MSGMTGPNGSDPGRVFKLALTWTAAAIVGPSILSGAGLAIQGFYFFWFLGLLAWLVAIPVAIGFAIGHKQQVASGILAGMGIGVVGLGLTCFANLTTGALF